MRVDHRLQRQYFGLSLPQVFILQRCVELFNSLDELSPYAVGELQLTDAIGHMVKNNEKVFAYKIQGTRYDIGSPLGWIKAVIGLSLQDPYYGPHVKKYLKDLYGIDSFLYNSAKNIEHTL